MNDLELLYLLEENGYEPSIENLKILKVESELSQFLMEDFQKDLNESTIFESRSSFRNKCFRDKTEEERAKSDATMSGHYAAMGFAKAKNVKNPRYKKWLLKRAKADVEMGKGYAAFGVDTYTDDYKHYPGDTGNHSEKPRKTIRSEVLEHKPKMNLNILRVENGRYDFNYRPAQEKAGKGIVANKHFKKADKLVREDLSDYELYQILDENGYTTTKQNLEILKEGLESGKFEILDEASTATKRAAEAYDMNEPELKDYTEGKLNSYYIALERKRKKTRRKKYYKTYNKYGKKIR